LGVDLVATLARTRLFSLFPTDELEGLAPALRLRTFAKGSYVFHEGDPGTSIFVVHSGQIKISRMGRGGEEVVFACLLPGDFFGELALFDTSAIRTADAQALELTECVALGREPFLSFVEAHPRLIRALVSAFGEYLRRADEAFADAAFIDIPARVAGKLLDLSETHGVTTPAGRRIRVRLSQRTLAGMVAASRESVNRALRRFELRGDIIQKDGFITVVRPAALRKRS
jgi:CRP/FNR family transcriptional regulator, cyclic AMP receptor protein